MRFRTSMFLITLFVACFTIAAWSTPLTAQPAAESLATHARYLIAVGENRICRRCEILRPGRVVAPSMLGYSGWPAVRALVSRKGWGISPRRLLIFLYRPAAPQPSLGTVVPRTPPAIVSRERREKPGPPPASPAATSSTVPNPSSFHLCALCAGACPDRVGVANSGVRFALFGSK